MVQLTLTATSYGGVTTLYTLEEDVIDEEILNNIKYVMDGLQETRVEGEQYYVRVANMKRSKFSLDWVKL